MKKEKNIIEYSLKGMLTEFDDTTILVTQKKGKEVIEDRLDIQELLADIRKFVEANMEKNIEFNCSMKLEE